jgi:hypothetical protein
MYVLKTVESDYDTSREKKGVEGDLGDNQRRVDGKLQGKDKTDIPITIG